MRIYSKPFMSFLLFMIYGLISVSCGNERLESSNLRKTILDKLDKITSYEMNVVYSESAGDEKSDFVLQSNCKTEIKFSKPKCLYIDAIGTIQKQSGGRKKSQIIRIYTTFDGEHQKARFSSEANGCISTNSIVLDMSINPPETPFNGWNLKGFGLLEGKDYIGTIKTLINQYDFQESGKKGNIVIFSGTLNVERYADMFSESMSEEQAQLSAKSIAESHKAFSLRFDTTRNIVVGYTLSHAFGKAIATRKCRFEGIKINQKIAPGVFVFKSLPDEKFTDITESLRKNRAMAQKVKESL